MPRSAATCSALVPHGWSYDPSRGVCAHSAIQLGPCFATATASEASAHCLQHRVRLCTLSELHIAKGTGCGFDAQIVWASGDCAQNGSVTALGGNPTAPLCETNATAQHAVRCCADDTSSLHPNVPPPPPVVPAPSPSPLTPPLPPPPRAAVSHVPCAHLQGWVHDDTLGVCASSSAGMGGCATSESFANASARCAAHGARLCMHSEIHIAKGTGCGADALHVWVYDQCTHNNGTSGHLAAFGGHPRNARCESHLDSARNAVRCCADYQLPPANPPHAPTAESRCAGGGLCRAVHMYS